MTVGLYMDVHIPRAITNGLRMRGIDVLTAQEDGTQRLTDKKLLDRATSLGRILYSQDVDLLAEAHDRLQKGVEFCGVVFSQQLRSPIGNCIEDLELISKNLEMADILNRVEFIPY